ncbi:MAG: hypothetical protein ACI8XB_000784 [Patiriisocius sp.]|jgi:hypothetical protein
MKISIGARVKHPTFGEGIVTNENVTTWKVFFRGEDKEIAKSFEHFEVLEYGQEMPNDSLELKDVEKALKKVLTDFTDIQHVVEMGNKWNGGTMSLQPENLDLKPKEIPIETFFHKIVMIRDRMRVLEQNINSHKVLTDEEKVHLQQYVSRCYGSLTTFNVFFTDKEDYFSGS